MLLLALLPSVCIAETATPPQALKVHAIFSSNMVIQRGKARLEYRRTEEAKRALEIIERLKTLGKPKPSP